MESAPSSSSSTQKQTSTKKINDVNHDCLENSLKYLSFEELLNVADSNQHLRESAELMYKINYSRKHLIIYNGEPRLVSHYINENTISIYTLKMVLQTLRCFGRLAPNIDIRDVPQEYGKKNLIRLGQIMKYVNDYCPKSFITIRICTDLKGLLHQNQGPFLKIENIEVYEYNLTTSVLNQLFPNMLHLTMNYGGTFFEDGRCTADVEKYIPYLKHLEIITDYFGARYCIRTRRQTKHKFQRIILKNIKRFGEIRSEFPETRLPFDHLEELHLHISFFDDDKFFSFFRKYSTVLKLKLSLRYKSSIKNYRIADNVINIPKLATTFSSLKEIDLRCCNFTANGINQLINQFKALEKFCVHFENHSEYIDVENRLRSEWQGSMVAIENRYECEFHRKP